MLLNSPNQISSLEGWLLKNGLENSKRPTNLSLLLAFTRPTFIAAEEQQQKMPPNKPKFSVLTYLQNRDATLPEAPSLCSEWQPSLNSNISTLNSYGEPPPQYKRISSPYEKPKAVTNSPQWSGDLLLTKHMTKRDLDIALQRMCTEIDWDWFNENYAILNSTLENETSQAWVALASIYQAYIEGLVGNLEMDMVWASESSAKGIGNVMEFYRAVMHCMMYCFAGESWEGWTHTRNRKDYTPEEKGNLELFAKALVSGGNIESFLEERGAVSGLTYPGGNGMFKTRLRKAINAKRNKIDFPSD
ncbi:hypothetical protein BGZ60DRAFT_528138 [Tricladium varicosporioides]|nr:hypothetical protein BGZ60DRAFT_528138 [Hymenoscyphus varicosporioides]